MASLLYGFALAAAIIACGQAQQEENLLEESAHAIALSAPVGGSAMLECDVTPQISGDKLRLAIWYKQGHTNPIYSLDMRKGVDQSWSDENILGERAKFQIDLNPAALVIKRIRAEDSGQYRCRVDFAKSPTHNARHNLTILLPPEKLLVVGDNGTELLNGTLGPYDEGTHHNITCVAIGGEPAPRVSWWMSHALISGEQSKVTIQIRAERQDQDTELTCQAVTDQAMSPVSVTYRISVNLKPVWVKIQGDQRPLVAGQRTELICQVAGARPKPSISWWKSGNRMRDVRESVSDDGNMTTSIVSFIPEIADAGKIISCRSVQTHLTDSTREDGWKLIIHHTPVATIELGASLNGANIIEGSDVYLDCKVKANPPHHLIYFTHHNEVIKPGVGVIVSNQSLVLQKVPRTLAGMYLCKAKNQLGEESSNKLWLDVKYAPQCQAGGMRVFRAARGEIISITCNLDANPSENLQYRWWFNETSHSKRELATTAMSQHYPTPEEKGTSGILQYKVDSSSDYGWVICSATNSVGEQRSPCVYQIVPADKPSTLVNCDVFNITYSALSVSCTPGKDGGIKQSFLFNIYDMATNKVLKNITSEVADIKIEELPPGSHLLIHAIAFNRKGNSEVYRLQVATLKYPEKITGYTPVVVQLTPLLAFVTGITIVIIVLAVITVILVRCRSKSSSTRNNRGNSSDAKKCTPDDASNSPLTASKDNDSIDSLDKNPDIIPLDCKPAYDARTSISDHNSMKPLLVRNPEKMDEGSLKRLQADSASQFSQYSDTDFTQGQYIQIRPIDYRLRPPQMINPGIYSRQNGGRHVYDTVYEDMLKFRNSPCGLMGSDVVTHHPELYISPHGPLHAVYTNSEREGTMTPTLSTGEPSRFDSPINVNEMGHSGTFQNSPYTLPMCTNQRLAGMNNLPYVISSTLPQVSVSRDRRSPMIQTNSPSPLTLPIDKSTMK